MFHPSDFQDFLSAKSFLSHECKGPKGGGYDTFNIAKNWTTSRFLQQKAIQVYYLSVISSLNTIFEHNFLVFFPTTLGLYVFVDPLPIRFCTVHTDFKNNKVLKFKKLMNFPHQHNNFFLNQTIFSMDLLYN